MEWAQAPPEPSPRHLLDRLGLRARTAPTDIAYRFLDTDDEDGRLLTYAELDLRARALGARLRAAGAEGERVLIVHAPGPDYVASVFGCWYAGAIAVPAYPPLWNRADDRLNALAGDCGARFAMTTSIWQERFESGAAGPSSPPQVTWITTDRIPDREGLDFVCAEVTPRDVALLQYTSGSTSSPKGVILTHAHFENNIRAFVERAGLTPADRVVSWLPPHHDLGLVTGILLPVAVGIEATILTPSTFLRRPHAWLQAISRFRATASGGPNFAYELCLRRVSKAQREALDLSTWRIAVSGAERVRAGTLDRFADAFAIAGFRRNAFRPTYGLAEATLGVALGSKGEEPKVLTADTAELSRGRAQPAERPAKGTVVVGCGRALPGFEVIAVDPDTRRVQPNGTSGEIWVHSDSVAAGYWGHPELTDSTFRARLADAVSRGPYLRTGDLGFLVDDEIFITGRLKDLMILAGTNHHPDDIEATIERCHPDLRAAVAFSVDVNHEERLVVVQEVLNSGQLQGNAIIAAIRDAVAQAHDLPVHDVVLVASGAIPKTSSGKLRRGACRTAYLEGTLDVLMRASESPTVAVGAPETVKRVAEMMAAVLGVESVGPDDNFFELGGHSLMGTQLVSRVRAAMSIDVPLRVVFEAPTAAMLAGRIEQMPKAEALASIQRVDRSGPLPLSFAQERMWFLNRVDPSSAAYNVAGALLVTGPLSYGALERAIRELAARHEILRTSYLLVDGVPRTTIRPVPELRITPVDVSGEVDPETRALAHAAELARSPFNVETDLLARFFLYHIGTERHLLAASFHHMITDAWAMGVLTRELFDLYTVFERGAEPERLEERIGYVDYAVWQRTMFTGDRLAADVTYWKATLRGVAPLEVPSDRPRSMWRSSRGALEPLELSVLLREELRSIGTAHNATQFMVLLAAFAAVLARHTQQWDFVVGVPVANRNHLASEHLLGTLVNTLPVRVSADPDLSFTQLLARIRQAALDAYAHQDLPFERLVTEMNVPRVPGQSPLVQVMFDYQNAPTPTQDAGSLRIRPVPIERGAAQFDLSLVIFDTALGHTALIEYATDLFDVTTVRRFLGHYVRVLQSVVANPTQSLSRIPLMGGDERAAILARASGSFAMHPAHKSPAHTFEEVAARFPDAPAVQDMQGTLSYSALNRRAAALATHLRRLGLGPGQRAAILLDRSSDVVVALLAVAKVGAAYVPIDPHYPADRIAFVLKDATPRVVLTKTRLGEGRVPSGTSDSAIPTLYLDVDPNLYDDADNDGTPPAVSDPNAPAYVLYTSGSTGQPKGVTISVRALANFLRSMAHSPGLQKGDRVLSVTTIAFDISGLELWLPLVTGASVFVAPDDIVSDGRRLRALVEQVAPTLMQATPATWRILIEAGWRGDSGLRVLCGGESFPRDLAEALLARAASVWNMYGPTETTIWSSLHKVTHAEGLVPIGRPIDRTHIRILDRHGEIVPFGVTGEIVIGGEGVAQGYLGRPDLTAERFITDPFTLDGEARMYRTGDLGSLHADGTLHHLGRLDQQVKLRGFRIEPGEIEAALEDAGTKESVVVLREDRPGDARLVAYYVEGPSTPTPSQLQQGLRTRLPPHMLPTAYVRLEALPLTPNGKIDRQSLPPPDLSCIPDREHVPPRDELEATLARIWGETLGIEAPSVRDDFFALGGHSLLAVKLLARLASELHIDLPLRALLDDPTIEALATRIRASEEAPQQSDKRFRHLVPIRDGGHEAPLVCVHGAGGHVLNMPAIARHLGLGRPFLGVQARGADGISDPLSSIEEMAEAYLAELHAVQPEGPYYLSGYCGGGLVAFEMARILQSRGQKVGFLALIDTYRPGSVPSLTIRQRLARRVAEGGSLGVLRRALSALRRDTTAAGRRLAIAYHRFRGAKVPHALRDAWLTWSFLKVSTAYKPLRGGFQGRLYVLRARDVAYDLLNAEPDLGWRGFATEGVECCDISGSHDMLSEDPHVAVLGATLLSCLTRSQDAARRSQETR